MKASPVWGNGCVWNTGRPLVYYKDVQDWIACDTCDCDPSKNKNLSPVKIDTSKTKLDATSEPLKVYSGSPPNNLYRLKYFWKEDKKAPNVNVLSIDLVENDKRKKDATYISGLGDTTNRYFKSALILFGNLNTTFGLDRSLHQIDGKTFPMEIVMMFSKPTSETIKPIPDGTEIITQVHVIVKVTDKDNPMFSSIVTYAEVMKSIYSEEFRNRAKKSDTVEVNEQLEFSNLLREQILADGNSNVTNGKENSPPINKGEIQRRKIGQKKKKSKNEKSSKVKELQKKIEKLTNQLLKLKAPAGEVTIKNNFQISGLLPTTGGYYSYSGSTPIPPCRQKAYVAVMENPINISKKQFNKLVELFTQQKIDYYLYIDNMPHDPLDISIPPIHPLLERQISFNRKNIQFNKPA